MRAHESVSGAMTDTEPAGRAAVRARINREMAAQRLTISGLADKAGINRDTLSNWLSGKSWPRTAGRASVEHALGLPEGELDALEAGAAQVGRSVGQSAESDRVSAMTVTLAGSAIGDLAPTEREEVIAAAKAAALQRIREIRGT